MLLACGTSVCGASAIMAVAGAVKAKDEEIVLAVHKDPCCASVSNPCC